MGFHICTLSWCLSLSRALAEPQPPCRAQLNSLISAGRGFWAGTSLIMRVWVNILHGFNFSDIHCPGMVYFPKKNSAWDWANLTWIFHSCHSSGIIFHHIFWLELEIWLHESCFNFNFESHVQLKLSDNSTRQPPCLATTLKMHKQILWSPVTLWTFRIVPNYLAILDITSSNHNSSYRTLSSGLLGPASSWLCFFYRE